jgi:hypothetical protein
MGRRLLSKRWTWLLLALTGCQKQVSSELPPVTAAQGDPIATAEMNEGMDKMARKKSPVVKIKADIETYAGDTALIYGTYVEIDTRKASTSPPVYAGHAAVQLADGTQILLGAYWQDSAIRPEKERNQLRDKEVIAEGLLHPICPPNPAGASLEVPCLYPLLYVLTPEVQALLAED